jgi:uncharacterized surface protein with fasciclin (FAS1) repeats
MKKIIIKPLASMAIVAFTMFSCAGPTGTATDTDRDRDQTAMDTETRDERTGMAGDQTTGMETETRDRDQTTGIAGDETTGMDREQSTGTSGDEVGIQDRELLADEPVAYNEILDDVEDTENYDVLTLLRMDENFSTFVQLLEQTGLEASLEQVDEMTALIPTNQAFQDMSVERYEYLTDPENRNELRRVIQAHILPSEVPSVAFESNQRITTPDGDEIDVTTEANGTAVYVGGAQLVRTDIEASNGIIHVVDGIIDPTVEPAGIGPYDE